MSGCSGHHYINQAQAGIFVVLMKANGKHVTWGFLCAVCTSIPFHCICQSVAIATHRGRLVFNWSTNAFSCTLTTKLPLFPGHILGTDIYIKAFAVARTNHYKQFLLFVLWQQMWCKHWLLKATILPHQETIIILILVGNIISLAGTFSNQSVICGILIISCIIKQKQSLWQVIIRPLYIYLFFIYQGTKTSKIKQQNGKMTKFYEIFWKPWVWVSVKCYSISC